MADKKFILSSIFTIISIVWIFGLGVIPTLLSDYVYIKTDSWALDGWMPKEKIFLVPTPIWLVGGFSLMIISLVLVSGGEFKKKTMRETDNAAMSNCGRRVNGVEGSVLWICPDDGVFQDADIEAKVAVRRRR